VAFPLLPSPLHFRPSHPSASQFPPQAKPGFHAFPCIQSPQCSPYPVPILRLFDNRHASPSPHSPARHHFPLHLPALRSLCFLSKHPTQSSTFHNLSTPVHLIVPGGAVNGTLGSDVIGLGSFKETDVKLVLGETGKYTSDRVVYDGVVVTGR